MLLSTWTCLIPPLLITSECCASGPGEFPLSWFVCFVCLGFMTFDLLKVILCQMLIQINPSISNNSL